MNSWETDWSGDMLERIVALLFALANLADLAAGLPFLRRQQLLGVLSHGEAEARAFLIGTAGPPAPTDAPDAACGAAQLAARLRALALLLCTMLAWRFALPGASRPRADRRKPAAPAGCLASLPAPDTS